MRCQTRAPRFSPCAQAVGAWHRRQAQYDFSALDKQITYAEQHGLRLALINEINPLYTPPWLRRLAAEAGQTVHNANGTAGPIPSITSPVFVAGPGRTRA